MEPKKEKNMADTELKTLKDLTAEFVKEGFCDWSVLERVRQEAIKRVKACRTCFGKKGKRCSGCDRDIWFHDLTEEEMA